MNKEILKKNNITSNNNNSIHTAFIVLGVLLGMLFVYTTAIQPIQILVPANAVNATQQAKSAANQTGEKMQAGAANVTQTGKTMFNKTGETLKSFANKTGEVLQKINPLKR